jgi:hypothetical protein
MSLLCAQMGMNVVFSAQTALPADLQGIQKGGSDSEDEGTRGIVSGYVALHSFMGAGVAMVTIYLLRDYSVQANYPIYLASVFIACCIICMSVQEVPTDSQQRQKSLTFQEIRDTYLIDMHEDLDFFWVIAGRMFYYISTSSVVFMYYYLRDMIVVGDESAIRSHLAALCIIAQLVGAIVSIPCSHLSNKVGRKAVIYGANALMASTFIIEAFAPKLGSLAWPSVLLAGIGFGAGNGAYLSVDYALALDCMPAGKTTAEAFGLWGVAGFFGTTLGPFLGGLLLTGSLPPSGAHRWPSAEQLGHMGPLGNRGHTETRLGEEYPYIGYVMILLTTGTIMNVMVAVLTAKIKGLPTGRRNVPECTKA